MAVIGDVLVKLVADFAEFSKGMQESSKQLDDFAKKATGVAEQIESTFKAIKSAAVVVAIVEVVKTALEEVDRLQEKFTEVAETGKKLGASFDEFERLRLAALDARTGTDQLTETMTRLKGVTDQALQGNKATIDALT